MAKKKGKKKINAPQATEPQPEQAVTVPVPAERTEITLTNTAGLADQLRWLGKRVCFVQMYMRGKVHNLRKYHPETKDANPYYDVAVKYSTRAGWLNRDTQEVKNAFLAKKGEGPEPLEDHRYAVRDPNCPLLGTHINGQKHYLNLNPQQEMHYVYCIVDRTTGQELDKETIYEYVTAEKRDTYHINPLLENIIELRGGFWMKKRGGERRWIKFHLRNADNLTTIEAAMADRLPNVLEQPDDYSNEEPA